MGYICAVKNCGHNTARDKGKDRLFSFPARIVNQGKEIRELSEQRRRQWFANIYRKEFDDKKAENSRVCSSHFILHTIYLPEIISFRTKILATDQMIAELTIASCTFWRLWFCNLCIPAWILRSPSHF